MPLCRRLDNIGNIESREAPEDAFILEFINLMIVSIRPTPDEFSGGQQSSGNPNRPPGSPPDSVHGSVHSFVAAENAKQRVAREELRAQAAEAREAAAEAARQAEAQRAQAAEAARQAAAQRAEEAEAEVAALRAQLAALRVQAPAQQ